MQYPATIEAKVFRTADEWRAWLNEETERFLRGYENDPRRLLSDKGGERNASRDYHGREILELLQNANDAAAEKGENSRVRIELSEAGLIVANTGAPFRPGGVTSLVLANLSPKSRDSRVIGNKGLGFRAVLNWSNRPIIVSAALRLGFAPEFARAHEARIQHLLEFLPNKDAVRLPVLLFPAFLDALPDGLPDTWYAVFRDCEKCQQNYDTAIGLPFDGEDGFAEASSQIGALGPEVLLFVKHLDSIEIVVPNAPTRTWEITREGSEAIVSRNQSELKSWTIWPDEGEIPSELVTPDGPSRYELAIAISEQLTSPGRLFSHFETQVEFPYPVVCHASFELDQGRNHIVQGPLNEFVLQKLAALHSQVVEEMAEKNGAWAGGKLALRVGQAPELFPRGDYTALLVRNLKQRRFLPCIDGTLRRPTDARFVAQASPTWLPLVFGDVVNVDGFPGAADLLRAVEVSPLGEPEWRERIEQLDFTDVEQIANLVVGLIGSEAIKLFKPRPPYLLTDSRGERIEDSRVYVSGSEEMGLAPPDWLSIRFLHPGLRERLQQRLGAPDVRDLAARLKMHGFDAAEYNTASVSGAAVTQAEDYIAVDPGIQKTVRHELLSFLYQVFLKVRSSETNFRPIAGLQVPNLRGDWTPAVGAHFSKGYGEYGEMLHALYALARPDVLIASPETFAWSEDKAALGDFLKWIGVHSFPRDYKLPIEEADFLDHVKSHLPEPFHVDRGEFWRRNDVGSYSRRVDAISVVGLAEILHGATPEAILNWVSKDGRWGKWAEPSREHGSFRFIPPGCSAERTYDGPIPSYPYWLIQRSPWLTGDDGRKHAPSHMLLTEDSRISGIIARPAVHSSEQLSEETILSALYRVGLSPNITALHPSAFYGALRKCAQISARPASSFYNFIIKERKAIGDRALVESTERRAFVREGRLWCDFEGSVQLVSVERCRYRRGHDIPKGISQYVPLVMLPVKRGAERVENLFGIKPLKDSGYQICNSVERDGSSIIQAQLSRTVEAILMLRQSDGRVERAQQDALENLQVHVCSEVTAVFVGEDAEREVKMDQNEWVLTNGNRALYVVCAEGNDVSLKNESLVNAVAEAIASIFGITDSSQFARLIQAADDQQRLALLSSLLGEAPDQVREQLADLRLRIEQQQRGGRAIPKPPTGPIEEGKKVLEVELTEDGEKNQGEQSFDGTGKVKVEPLEHVAQKPRKVTLRVTRKTTESSQVVLRHSSRANGEEAERIAEAFERSEGRFPVRVGFVQGSDGAGCDILSFDTEEQANAAETGLDKNPFDKARRIIEVKGRKDQRARIVLDGYEYEAACNRAGRYFLYRIYADEEAGTWQVAVLQNPAQTYSAHINTLVVSFEATDATKKYRISLQEDLSQDAPAADASTADQLGLEANVET